MDPVTPLGKPDEVDDGGCDDAGDITYRDTDKERGGAAVERDPSDA